MLPDAVIPVVRALAARVVEDELGEADPKVLDETAEALARKLDGMPTHLRGGLVAATALFGRASFHHASAADQRARIRRWKRLGGPFRDFFAFYEKMSLFLYLSIREGE